ncbi:MAG TPA: hypothetical protein VNR18_06085 [Hyphomicrobiales bacterium]|nr:hypothetical protein [Hyphomicrobiales bacterium]
MQPPRKVSAILKDIKRVEADTNKLFNQLNSSNDYDLVCYAFKQTGSKTRQRICEPQFMKNARNADAQRFVNGTRQGTDLAVPQSDAILQGMVQDEMAGLRRELQAVSKESPEFAALMQQLQELVKEYTAHDKARNNDPALGFLSRFMQTQYR